MKEITGYLIDRTTGAGIASKAVAFKKLDGSAVSTAETYYQDVSATTDSDGKFYGKFELSPGPVKVEVTVSGSEKKVRKHDEKAQMGVQWSSDISRLGFAVNDGFVKGFLNEMALSIGAGHNIQIATGAAIVGGVPFTIENGQMTIAGTSNPGGSGIDPRLDLITLRQYKESASGQNAGKQAVIITNGTTSNVVPATPTGSDFTDLPLGVVSTAMGASTKTVNTDKRVFTNSKIPIVSHQSGNPPNTTVMNYNTNAGVPPSSGSYMNRTYTVTGLDPSNIYDGWAEVNFGFLVTNGSEVNTEVHYALVSNQGMVLSSDNWQDVRMVAVDDSTFPATAKVMLSGITGVSQVTFNLYGWHKNVQVSSAYTTGSSNFTAFLVPRK